SDEVQALLAEVIADAHRANQVMQSIGSLFGKTDGRDEPVDVNEVALGVLRNLHVPLADNNIATRLDIAELPPVMGNRGQLQEVITNLVHNAIEALETVKDDRWIILRTGTPNDAVVIELEDSGPGIDPGVLDKIFDPFTTTKSKGMGLGLAICQTIVE